MASLLNESWWRNKGDNIEESWLAISDLGGGGRSSSACCGAGQEDMSVSTLVVGVKVKS